MPYPLPVTVVSFMRLLLYMRAVSVKDLVIVFHNSKPFARYLLFLSHFHFANEFLFAVHWIYFVSFTLIDHMSL